MRNLHWVLIAVIASGCATVWRFDQINAGDSRARVLRTMGTPDNIKTNDKGEKELSWLIQGHTRCAVLVSQEDKVVKKACANNQTRWASIVPGLPRADVLRIMGDPDEFMKDQGKDVLVWNADRFEKCAVYLGTNGTVEGKLCKDNSEARAIANDTMMRAFRPAQAPTQSRCTTTTFGGVTNTDCNSR